MSEILSVPEEHLEEVIRIIRRGLALERPIKKEVVQQLKKWCNEESAYLKRLKG